MAEHDIITLPAHLSDSMRVFERGWLSSNNILFFDDDAHGGCALVDTGYFTHAPQTVALVQHALQGKPLRRLLNTHLHSDHCGGNAALQALYTCHTRVPAAQIDDVRRWDTDALSYGPTGQECARFTLPDEDAGLSDGMTVRLGGFDWQVISAPGHDPNAVILYSPDTRVLLSADALWERGFGVIFPELEGESGFAEQEAILARIAQLDARVVIPGHGRPFPGVNAAIDASLGRLAYLRADPERNALHAIRVLVKFKLLEQQALTYEALSTWFMQTSLMPRLHARFFASQSMTDLLDGAIAALVKAGAATVEHGQIRNCD
ncbi:MBL fold metallo-hydrolase [uncultured Ralstonia sp.]|jgi:glyoxylase-like metal-dependent hydrolase (beta-lactamase superfamily II)|uniref:MBL fold metallo-hydrolase n=1 Tax=Ralstonia sp. TaxID=54061 RepID=UPI0025EE3E87|nr:MBL fold metallo-hydrolase [uncultured Ralstonia sp.]